MSLLLRSSRHAIKTPNGLLSFSPRTIQATSSFQHRRTLFGVGDPVTWASISAGKTILWSVIGINASVFGAWKWAQGGPTVPMASTKTQNRIAAALSDNFLLKPSDVSTGKWWTSITSAFSHQNLYHILGNMFTLHAFGSVLIYSGVPPAAMCTLMLGSTITASVAFLVDQRKKSKQTWARQNVAALGASGMVMGLGAAAAMLAPMSKMLLFGVVPVPMWAIFAGYTFYDTYYLSDRNSRTGHAAHLGGGVFGAAFYLIVLRRLGGVAAF